MNDEVKKPKASDRLAAMETAVFQQEELLNNTARRAGEMEMIIFNLSRENEMMKDALQIIHEKLDAVISLSNGGEALTAEAINEKITEQKVDSLKSGIEKGLEANQIEKADAIGANSLVVSRELAKTGEVENPRLQFMTARLNEDLVSKFVGKVVGDLIKGEEDRLDLEIIEIYNFVEQELAPPAPEAEEQSE
tara:strand:+ start:588 stop:1166 length:579 start_codon:yes stop_codon:yes gene_type:complete